MKLLIEKIEEIQYLTEEENGKKHFFIEGVFCQAEKQNKNGRVYPFQVLNKEVARYNKEYISKNRAFGELSHPNGPSINLDRVSHMITKLVPDGNNFIGKAKILDTPMGNIVRGLLDSGASLGVSTRGVGSLKPVNGFQLVQDDFKLATAADIVHEPSAPDAWVSSILENKEWIFENGGWREADHEKAVKRIKMASRRQIEEVSLDLFKKYMSKL